MLAAQINDGKGKGFRVVIMKAYMGEWRYLERRARVCSRPSSYRVTTLTANFMNVEKSVTMYRGADKFLARPGRKQATATEDFDFHISS